MTGHIYRDVILEQHVRLFWGAMDAEFLFMDDNTRPPRADIVDECLQLEDITPSNFFVDCSRLACLSGKEALETASPAIGLISSMRCRFFGDFLDGYFPAVPQMAQPFFCIYCNSPLDKPGFKLGEVSLRSSNCLVGGNAIAEYGSIVGKEADGD
ncbi:DDE_3 domain-containing protein [Trichonephila clavipes]|nr:DDE_3 domain-containing protein [Trichonephila clavipes]